MTLIFRQVFRVLEAGVSVELNGSQVVLVAPTLCYVGDMPQQAANSGFRGARASKFCRHCYVYSGDGNDEYRTLEFDHRLYARTHYQTLAMQRYVHSLRVERQRTIFRKQWGLADVAPALVKLSPALDLQMTRPPDPAHSELQGMGFLLHHMLLTSILTPAAGKEYWERLRKHPFPPGWERLQSPIHHLKSYSLSAHARWSVVVPTLLRSWLEYRHLNANFARGARSALEKRTGTATGLAVVDTVVEVYANHAWCNTALLGGRTGLDMAELLIKGRRSYVDLATWSAKAARASDRRRYAGSTRGSIAGSLAGSLAGSARGAGPDHPDRDADEDLADGGGNPGNKKGLNLDRATQRPNMHLAVHYPSFADEYGPTINISTLMGEAMHR